MNYLYDYLKSLYPTTTSAHRLEHIKHDVLNSKAMPNVYGTVKCVCCEHYGAEYDKLTSLQLKMTDNTTVNLSVGTFGAISSYLMVPLDNSGYAPSWLSLEALTNIWYWRRPEPVYINKSYKDLADSVLVGIVVTDYISKVSNGTSMVSFGEDLSSLAENVQEESYEITIYFRKGSSYYQTKLLYRNLYNYVEGKARYPNLFVTRY